MTSATLERPTISITDTEGIRREFDHIVGRPVADYLTGTECKTPVDGEVAYVDGIPQELSTAVDPGVDIQIGGQPING
jgi:hypothetical protein